MVWKSPLRRALTVACVLLASLSASAPLATRSPARAQWTASGAPEPRAGSALDFATASLGLFVPDGGGVRPRGQRLFQARRASVLGSRSAWFIRLLHDHGPEPRGGVVRRIVDTRFGVLTRWAAGRIMTSTALRAQLLAPAAFDALPDGYQLRRTTAVMVELVLRVDLRERARDPRRGFYLRAALQQAGLAGASSWSYLRATAELRAYAPLPGRMVLAARLALGGMFMLGSRGLDASSVHELDTLGPPSEQLQGGGVNSQRGYRRGGLGGIRRAVTARGPDGSVAHYRPLLITGGTRRWEGSLELRIQAGRRLGAVLFTDLGSVSRGPGLDLAAINLAWGIGLRKRTKLGMLRLEWAFRPQAVQRLGGGTLRSCVDADDFDCRPRPRIGRFPGALHLALAEPF